MHRDSLSYAVRIGVVLKYTGQLCLVAAALTLVPLCISLFFREYGVSLRYLLVGLSMGTLGAIGARLPRPRRVQHNEALVIAAGIFVISSLVMAVPIMGSGFRFADAWFEATSAITTTGLSTNGNAEDHSTTFELSRAWLQWNGGLGIVVLSLGLAMQPGLVARRLALTQADETDIVGSTRAHARRVLLIYVALTAVAVTTLLLTGAGWFYAIVHGLPAVATSSFSSHDGTLAALPLAAQMAVAAISLAASVSLPLYWMSGRKPSWALLKDLQLRTLLWCSVLSMAILFLTLVLKDARPWSEALRQACLNAISAQTTAGFSTIRVAELDAGTKLILIASMAIGGSTGSTAGGFKLLRLLVVLRALQLMLFRTTLTKHAVEPSRFAGRKLDASEREEAYCVVLLFALTVFASWLAFVLAGFDPLDSLFEVVSATGTVGISAGICGPDLPTWLKGILCLDMLLGRVEFVALLVVVYPRTWVGRRTRSL